MNIIVCTRYRPTDDDDDGRHDYDKHNNHDGGGDYQDDHLYFGVVHSSNNLTMSGITLRGSSHKGGQAQHQTGHHQHLATKHVKCLLSLY